MEQSNDTVVERVTCSEQIICGDSREVLKTLATESVDCVITSPPYFGLRDYGMEDQIGLEESPEKYTAELVALFREVRRVLKRTGTLWLNLGDSYNSNKVGNTEERLNKRVSESFKNFKKKFDHTLKQKDLVGIPWRVAFALQADGWYLRQDIIWSKPNPMPESVTDRCTKSHEYIFLLTKSPQYHFDCDAIKERAVMSDPRMVDGFGHKSVNGKHKEDKQNAAHRKQYKPTEAAGGTSFINHDGYFKANGDPIGTPGYRNKRSVWSITTSPYADAHFATFPEKLVEPMILAGCPKGGVVLDPFNGAATTGVVSKKFGRSYIGIELNPAYIEISKKRLNRVTPPLF